MTVALDANVILRLVLRDDEGQWQAAERLFATERVFVSAGVWLEVEWVMRRGYDLDAGDFIAAARRVLGLDNVEAGDRAQMVKALEWHEAGMDFADALHLASAGPARRLATFDRNFRTRANRLQNQIEVITP